MRQRRRPLQQQIGLRVAVHPLLVAVAPNAQGVESPSARRQKAPSGNDVIFKDPATLNTEPKNRRCNTAAGNAKLIIENLTASPESLS